MTYLDKTRAKTFISLVLFILLMFLRFPLILYQQMTHTGASPWMSLLYEIGTYFTTLAFILLNLKEAKLYHIDAVAVVMLAVFKPLQTLLLAQRHIPAQFAFPWKPSLLLFAGAAVFTVLVIFRRRFLPKFNWRQLLFPFIGVIAGILLAGVLSYPASFRITAIERPKLQSWSEWRQIIFWSIPYAIGVAGVSEEPLFRGITWGLLRKSGVPDWLILLLQIPLSMIGYLFYWNSMPLRFWILVPVLALLTSFLVWRTRSISIGMAAHGAMNGAIDTFACIEVA